MASRSTLSQLGFHFEPVAAQPARRTWRVGELVTDVRTHIEREYADVWVEGEVSNLRIAPSGHIYFTLKDAEAQLPVVLFRRQAQLLRFKPQDGLSLLIRGRVSVFEQRGQMQLIAETAEPVGAGSLQLAFEQLRDRLRAEGLFDAAQKRPLPAFPRCIGLITSPTGAVVLDFLNIASRRHAALSVLISPVTVQGPSSVAEICQAIARLNALSANGEHPIDVLVLARGGGSLEDLAAFNSEPVARAIRESALPVVSAIGHETDFTIADFASDLRAPTPSAAAELLTEAQHKVEAHLEQLEHRVLRAWRYRHMRAAEQLARVSIEASAARLRNTLMRQQQRVDELQFRADASLRACLTQSSRALQAVASRLERNHVSQKLAAANARLALADSRLIRATRATLNQTTAHYRVLAGQLNSLSPLSVLNRGYALVFNEQGELVRDPKQAPPGTTVHTRLAQGSLTSTVTGPPSPDPDKETQ